MHYLGGLFEGTEMQSYSPVNREVTHKLKIDHTGIDDHNMVALFNLFLDYGTRFTAGGYEFLALPGNHTVEDLFEKTFMYLISGQEKTLLYALDTAWMPALAYRLLGKTRLDGVIWDGTMSEPGDWRIFEHSDPAMFAMMRKALTDRGNFDEKTRIWFDHRARTLWPADPEGQEAVARREKVELAHEGETVFL